MALVIHKFTLQKYKEIRKPLLHYLRIVLPFLRKDIQNRPILSQHKHFL